QEILDLYQKYVWGTVPPHPKFDHADVQETPGQGFRTRTVVLHVGPEGRGTMRVTLQIPEGDGIKGPFPVVLGPGLAGGFGGGGGGPRRGGARSGPGGAAPAGPGQPPAGGGLVPVIARGGGAAPGARGPAGGSAGTIRAHGYIVASLSAADGNDDSANI